MRLDPTKIEGKANKEGEGWQTYAEKEEIVREMGVLRLINTFLSFCKYLACIPVDYED